MSNCSLAYAKAQRFEDALLAADKAITLSPTWSKGHWRRGAALLGLRNVPAAVTAFHSAWQFRRDEDAECYKKLAQVIRKLTREQLGAAILELFTKLERDGVLRRPEKEATDAVSMREAAFRMIVDAHRGAPPPSGPYYASLLRWLTRGVDPGEAYSVRAAIHRKAKCYLQARADADAAIAELRTKLHRILSTESSKVEEELSIDVDASSITLTTKAEVTAALAAAYQRLGEAFLAETGHADRDPMGAFKALTRSTEYNSASQDLRDRLQEATEELTKEEVERAAVEVYNESGSGNGGGVHSGERVFRVEAVLAFPQGAPGKLQSEVREAMRRGLAAAADVSPAAVSLEGVRPARPPTRLALEITAHVVVGTKILQGNALVNALVNGTKDGGEQLESAIGGADVVAALGAPDPAMCRAEIVDITPECMNGGDGDDGGAEEQQQRQLVIPSRPKLELEVPYKMYRLVTACGNAVERTDKHPFAMSRVYYDAAEKPEEVWVELADGSCRWRQTAGEVRVLALKVPHSLSPRELQVDISPYHVKIFRKGGQEVYLEGRLHRGVVPEDCFWTHCGGEGEDGCCITLRKMNLKVIQRHWQHSESWWNRLFREHNDIAWDDYEKDYSDLPEEVMVRHLATEAIKDVERKVEGSERRRREVLQESDDLRKRRRQERLNVLRSGTVKDWVHLNRSNPGS